MKKLVLIVFFAVAVTPLFAQLQKNQSIFIFSFTRYIIWPDAYSTGDFEILVLGDSPILEDLKTLSQSKKVGDRPIKVTKIKSVAEIRKANILFVSSGKAAEIESIVSKVSTQSILVVTEEPGLAAKGSNINFIVKDGKLAFELNQASLTKQNLKASMELSRLAIMI
jgi:hypothetical protein